MMKNHNGGQVAVCLVEADPAVIGKLLDLLTQVSAAMS